MKRIFAAAFALFLLPACAAQAQTSAPSDAQIIHLLNRISFGPAPGDIAAVRQVGIDAYIEQQLHPENLSMPDALQERIGGLSTLNTPMAQLAEEVKEEKAERKQEKIANTQGNEENKMPPGEDKGVTRQIYQELAEAKLLRAIASPAQLQEVMTDFWFNHFNVFFKKELDTAFTGDYERAAIRPYALGKFRDLLEATAHHPAMLYYLDNWQNTDPNSFFAQRAAMRQKKKEIGINENYAREIMELHTLGVNGGYTQTDVTTLAHILTGWGLAPGRDVADRASFYFDPSRHDGSNQVLLGVNIPGGGQDEIEYVLNLLAHHPATAHHIAYELAQYFVADDPPDSLVNKLDTVYQQTDGDIAAMLRTIFHSEEFWNAQYTQNKFKPPLRYVVSALRADGVMPQGDTKALVGAIDQMGEPLYHCLTPNGYSNTNDQWLNSDALLKRINIAKGFGRFFDQSSPATIRADLGNTWSEHTLAAVTAAPPQLQPAMLLGSPEFLYY
jgi:uncharacterized protein (DUF1800 family)